MFYWIIYFSFVKNNPTSIKIFSLIITPKRGTLEELYWSIFPYENIN